MHIAVVIPAYNESKHIKDVIKDVQDQKSQIKGHKVSLIVVDDGSRDKTSELAKACGKQLDEQMTLHVLRHRTNLGKGAAAKTGCDAACKLKADLVVLMDADGQHKAADISRIVKPILHTKFGLVVGVRDANKKMPTMMRMGNIVLTTLSKYMFNISVRDIQSGFRAFTINTYPKIRWETAQYAMENEMLILAATHRIPTYEVGIPTIYHDNYKGTTVLDGIKVFKTMLGWWVFKFQHMNKLEPFSLEEVKVIKG